MKKKNLPVVALLLMLCALIPQTAFSAEKLKPAEVIIGLGAGPARDKKGRPNSELERRVVKAVELYQEGLAPELLFTGSDTGGGCEAEVMKEEAVKMGVPAEKIFVETRAVDTITNARYSVQLMKEHGWKSAILVSNPYHLQRGKWLFEANPGIEIQTAACATPEDPLYHLVVITHEAFAWTGYLFEDPRKNALAAP